MSENVFILDSFAIGKKAEEMAAKRIEKAGWQITDVRKVPAYQVKDIDYICSGDGDEWSVDIKTDRCYRTNNYFFETLSNIELDKPGWGYTSEANYILIVYPTSTGHELHVLDMTKTREWLYQNASKCRVITNTTKRENGSVYYSQGIIVNRRKFEQESGAVTQILSIETEKKVA